MKDRTKPVKGKVDPSLRLVILDLAGALNVGDRYGLVDALASLATLPNTLKHPGMFPLWSMGVGGQTMQCLVTTGVRQWAGMRPFDEDDVRPIAQAASERLRDWWVGDDLAPSLDVFLNLLCPAIESDHLYLNGLNWVDIIKGKAGGPNPAEALVILVATLVELASREDGKGPMYEWANRLEADGDFEPGQRVLEMVDEFIEELEEFRPEAIPPL